MGADLRKRPVSEFADGKNEPTHGLFFYPYSKYINFIQAVARFTLPQDSARNEVKERKVK